MDIEEEYDKIFRFCYFHIGNRTVAEDLTQETFLRFLDSPYKEQGMRMHYLYVIARNLCINEARKPKCDELTENVISELSLENDIEESLLITETLEKLPEDDRDLLIMRYMNDEPIGVIAEVKGLSRFAIYRRLKKAKEEFIKLMEGGTP